MPLHQVLAVLNTDKDLHLFFFFKRPGDSTTKSDALPDPGRDLEMAVGMTICLNVTGPSPNPFFVPRLLTQGPPSAGRRRIRARFESCACDSPQCTLSSLRTGDRGSCKGLRGAGGPRHAVPAPPAEGLRGFQGICLHSAGVHSSLQNTPTSVLTTAPVSAW